MTLLLGSIAGNEAYFGTDTLAHYSDGKLELMHKYKIISKLGVAIFPRGSNILTRLWIDAFEELVGSQTLSSFFDTCCLGYLKELVPSYKQHMEAYPETKDFDEYDYYDCTQVELLHCFFDENAKFRCILLTNTRAGKIVNKNEYSNAQFFSRPYDDIRLKVDSFSERFIQDTFIPVAKTIKDKDDKAYIKAVIGGDLEVIHFLDGKVLPLGSVYSFDNA